MRGFTNSVRNQIKSGRVSVLQLEKFDTQLVRFTGVIAVAVLLSFATHAMQAQANEAVDNSTASDELEELSSQSEAVLSLDIEEENNQVPQSVTSEDVSNSQQSIAPLAETSSSSSSINIDIKSDNVPAVTVNGQPVSDPNTSNDNGAIEIEEGNTSFNISINQSGGEDKNRTRQKFRIDTESKVDRDVKEEVDIRIRD